MIAATAAVVAAMAAASLLDSRVHAAAPPEWIGTVTATERQTNTDPNSPLTFIQAAAYTLTTDAADTKETTFAAGYSYDSKSVSPTRGILNSVVAEGAGTGTGGELAVFYVPGSGYNISTGSSTIEITTNTWLLADPEPIVSTITSSVATYAGFAFAASASDDQFVLQGSQVNGSAGPDFCVGTLCKTTTVTYSLRRTNCANAPDVDGDGLDACEEFDLGTLPGDPDTDDDGFADGVDECPLAPGTMSGCPPDGCGAPGSDDDGDGRADVGEGCEGGTDTDRDGTPDFLDSDSDNDGIPDANEGNGDSDGDGVPDWRDPITDPGPPDPPPAPGDTDGDGWMDAEETLLGTSPTDRTSHPLLTFDYDPTQFAESGFGQAGTICGTAVHDFIEVSLEPTTLKARHYGCVILLGNRVAQALLNAAFARNSDLTTVAAQYLGFNLNVIEADDQTRATFIKDVLDDLGELSDYLPRIAAGLRASSAIFGAGEIARVVAISLFDFFIIDQIQNENGCVQLLVNVDNGVLNVDWSMVYSTTQIEPRDKDLSYAHAYEKKVKNNGLDQPDRHNLSMRCVGGNVEVLSKNVETLKSFAPLGLVAYVSK